MRTTLVKQSNTNTKKITAMATTINRTEIFKQACGFVRNMGYTMGDALRTAWANAKFKAQATKKVVEFYFKKADGTIRQAFGTICPSLCPETKGGDDRKKSDLIQTYFDTEKQEWRCFKKFNLLTVK